MKNMKTKDGLAVVLIVVGFIRILFPSWRAFLLDYSASQAEVEILTTIAVVGGLILWYLPDKNR